MQKLVIEVVIVFNKYSGFVNRCVYTVRHVHILSVNVCHKSRVFSQVIIILFLLRVISTLDWWTGLCAHKTAVQAKKQ